MKAVLQRVLNARVVADGVLTGEINQGLLVLLGIGNDDDEAKASILASKTANLRIFCDENDKMNLSLLDIEGEALVISNFTLYADSKKGRRPNFIQAAQPCQAEGLYNIFVKELSGKGVKKVSTGVFGADMKIDMTCDGPVTIILDTQEMI